MSNLQIDTIRLFGKSLLDCIFISKVANQAIYVTTTKSSTTTLWNVIPLESPPVLVACIQWGKNATVSIGEEKRTVADFLKKGKGVFASDSRRFEVSDRHFKWKTAYRKIVDRPVMADGLVPAWRAYECHSSSTRVAALLPPQPGVKNPEMDIYESGKDALNWIVITALLLDVRAEEWREVQSARDIEEVLRHIRMLVESQPPPYEQDSGDSLSANPSLVTSRETLPLYNPGTGG